MNEPRRLRLRGPAQRACLFALALLSACAHKPAPEPAVGPEGAPAKALTIIDLAPDYRRLAAQGDGLAYTLDSKASDVRIYAFRGGGSIAFIAGHNHVLRAKQFTGYAFVPNKGMDGARFDIEVPLATLEIDDPELRAATGGTFEGTISPGGIEGTREHMLGNRSLDAAHFPTIRLSARTLGGELPKPIATVDITLHGQTHSQLVPLTVHAESGELRVQGAFALRQTDFGITPYTILGGTLGVQDEVAIEFTLVGRVMAP